MAPDVVPGVLLSQPHACARRRTRLEDLTVEILAQYGIEPGAWHAAAHPVLE